MGITRPGQTFLFFQSQLVRCSIASAFLDKGQRAIIGHKMMLEEVFRFTKALRKKFPQSLAADLRARAIETQNGPAGMLVGRAFNNGFYLHPVPHRTDFPERHPRLHHAKRPRIHAQENDFLPRPAKAFQVHFVSLPGIEQWIINMSHRQRKAQLLHFRRQFLRRFN